MSCQRCEQSLKPERLLNIRTFKDSDRSSRDCTRGPVSRILWTHLPVNSCSELLKRAGDDEDSTLTSIALSD